MLFFIMNHALDIQQISKVSCSIRAWSYFFQKRTRWRMLDICKWWFVGCCLKWLGLWGSLWMTSRRKDCYYYDDRPQYSALNRRMNLNILKPSRTTLAATSLLTRLTLEQKGNDKLNIIIIELKKIWAEKLKWLRLIKCMERLGSSTVFSFLFLVQHVVVRDRTHNLLIGDICQLLLSYARFGK